VKLKLLPVVLVLIFGFFATSVFAASDRAATVRNNPGAPTPDSILASPSASPASRGKSNLTAVKLKVCQAKENGITKKIGQLNRLAINTMGKFDAIALRVKNFYQTKVIASGKSLSNYDALVADIDKQKGLVTAAMTKTQTDSANFSCEFGDPKGLLNQYRLNMQLVKRAMNNYRTSIRNLIVGVHTLVPTTTSSDSATPSGSPASTATATSSATPTATASPTATPTPTVSPTASPTATPI